MRTDDFWLILERTRVGATTEATRLAALTLELRRLSDSGLREFENHLRQQLEALDTLTLRDIADQRWVISEEAWRHFRGWCVSEGREFVSELLADPVTALKRVSRDRPGPFDVPTGELFLYCAEYARVAAAKAVA